MGQQYLVAGKRVSMQLWVQEPGVSSKLPQRGSTKPLAMSSQAANNSSRRTDPKSKSRGTVVGAGGCDAPVHAYRALHSCRGDCGTGRGPRSRYAGLSRDVAATSSCCAAQEPGTYVPGASHSGAYPFDGTPRAGAGPRSAEECLASQFCQQGHQEPS